MSVINKKSQISEIITHLRKYKTVTSMEAIKKLCYLSPCKDLGESDE